MAGSDALERWIDRITVGVAFVVLVLSATGGPGWRSSDAVLAVELERTAAAPVYALVATVAAYLPVGEPGFRLALANAVLGAVLLVGVARVARQLLPKDPLACVVAVLVLALARPFRDAAGFAGPAMLASCGMIWAIAFALEHTRSPRRSAMYAAFACCTVVIGSAPWLGLLLGMYLAIWAVNTGAKDVAGNASFAIGGTILVLWIGAEGSLPAFDVDLEAAIASAIPATIALGVGLIGIGFATLTGLPHARWIAGAITLAAVHVVIIEREPLPMLALLAVGCAVIPGAITRTLKNLQRRHAIAAVAGAPIVVAALLASPAFSIDDSSSAPARLATDLVGALPPGPGAVFIRRQPAWVAVAYAQRVAGARPDLELALPDAPTVSDVQAKNVMMGRLVAGSDMPAFGRLDPRLAFPRGRGFQLLLGAPERVAPIPPPAQYASTLGNELATLLAVDRARYEAVHGRLGAAARAAGLTTRFGAGDLAILSTTALSRPAFFAFIPDLDGLRPGPWLYDLLGDDLAWSAGLEPPIVETPRERKLHALWRKLYRGEIQPNDPAITALGPDAVRATAELLTSYAAKPK